MLRIAIDSTHPSTPLKTWDSDIAAQPSAFYLEYIRFTPLFCEFLDFKPHETTPTSPIRLSRK